MVDVASVAGPGYTYDQSASAEGPEALLNLLLEYREAEQALRRRVGEQLQVGDLDLLALRYVMRAREHGEIIRPSDLRDLLGITTASTTTLIDRLEVRGYVRRQAHPSDRRSSQLVLDASATEVVSEAIDGMQSSILDVAQALTDEQRDAAIHVLRSLIAATRASNA